MSFKINPLYDADAYKVGHKRMLAPGTTKLYGTWIPRSTKHAPKGITKIVSFGQQLVWKWIHDEFEENFFFTNNRNGITFEHNELKEKALQFVKDMTLMLGQEYDGKHFEELWDLGYLPIKVKALPEGIETNPNIPHMTFVNTVDGFAWLTLYLETLVSSLAWKPSTAATIALQYRRNATKAIMETDPTNEWFIDYSCHNFSARGLDPMSQYLISLGHDTSFRGDDSLISIPAARYFYNEPEDESVINSVNASEHSVSCTQLFYYEDLLKRGLLNDKIKEYYAFDLPSDGDINNPDYLTIAEWIMIDDWLDRFPEGILSIVNDTMDTWKHITHVLARLKHKILARKGKLTTRPDSGDPVDIICGDAWRVQGFTEGVLSKVGENGVVLNYKDNKYYKIKLDNNYEVIGEETNDVTSANKGVIELLWDIFGGTVNEQGYKVLDSHIGCIYGDSITLDRQVQIYDRLKSKGFAATNIVLGVGSFTYQYNTRDTLGWAAKGAWFEVKDKSCAIKECEGGCIEKWNKDTCKYNKVKSYNIYKDPVTDDGTKKSLKGLVAVYEDEFGNYEVKEECTPEEESRGLLQVIYEDGRFYNQTTLTEIREKIKKLV